MNHRIFPILSFLIALFISVSGYSQNSDQKMQQLLQEKRAYNLSQHDVMGYRIQLYNGMNQTKSENIQGGFITLFPDIST